MTVPIRPASGPPSTGRGRYPTTANHAGTGSAPYDERLDPVFVAMLRTSITRLARSQRAERQRDPRALPFSLISALSTLQRLGPLTPTQLAHVEGVRKPSMTRALATLIERGLAIKENDEYDGRQCIVRISDQGLTAVQESRRVVDSWYSRRLRQLSHQDLADLMRAGGALARLASETT
ncbi:MULTISPECIES: MarR family winged helix-turn-helix transcriptional regulator [unclassified Frankia]|uniref:MarR family winged helix-turn-helix transcriptional regulator n=1 Tax=unclassified Frankia TaxID=2632575 RepID=UPI001EF5EA1B|nr:MULTISPECIES: MarR family winged helix-turn-helix transcriptional regulator [unclassified Frankia]